MMKFIGISKNNAQKREHNLLKPIARCTNTPDSQPVVCSELLHVDYCRAKFNH